MLEIEKTSLVRDGDAELSSAVHGDRTDVAREIDRFLARCTKRFNADGAILAQTAGRTSGVLTIGHVGIDNSDVREAIVASADAALDGGDRSAVPVAMTGPLAAASPAMLTVAFFAPQRMTRLSLTFVRDRRRGDFEPDEVARLGRELSWIDDWIELWSRQEHERARVRGLNEAAMQLDVGIVLLDGRGEIIDANSAADRILADRDGLLRSANAIFGQGSNRIPLQVAIQNALSTSGASVAVEPTVLLCPRTNGRALTVSVRSISNRGRRDPTRDPAAILSIVDPDRDIVRAVQTMCSLHRLTRTETRLTVFLARGLSLGQAAAKMGVGGETARAYLRQVFLKIGVNRQADLVRLILLSMADSH